MFSPNTAMRLIGCAGKQLKNGSERRRVLVLSFQLQPFTTEMAEDLSIKPRLFSPRSGDPLPEVITTTLAIAAPLVRLTIKSAPDAPKGIIINDVEVSPKLVVRKDKEGPVYSATLVLVMDYPSGDELLYLMQRVTEQFFISIEAEQGDMLARSSAREGELEDDDEPEPQQASTH